ncbi:MAG: TIM44-like domain-containing protein, partial [Victivallales bacterium]|nr:TIM44-like domain-containing protein [Victivallales bacterium]
QSAWSKQDLTPIHRFVSDAVYERFSLQIAEMKERGTRNVMKGVKVREATVATGGVDSNFQAITVRFQASAIDYEVNASGRVTSGDKSRQGFVEYWSFVRRPGAKTRNADGLFEGHCPNCGSPLRLNQTESCESCNAKVRSGRYDWILTEITQESEWKPHAPNEIRGVSAMAANDPGFCLQHLEDRASVVFWRRIAAWQSGKVLPLRKMSTPAYCEAMARDLRPDPDGTRPIPSGAAVGSVETEGILCESPLDQALVRIHWSSGTELQQPNGTRQRTIGVRFHVSFFLLTRKHGVKGDMDDALSSAHCPGCGAPVTNTVADACEYCGDAMANGEQDWLLANVCVADEKPVREFLSRLQEAKPRRKSRARSREAVSLPPASGRELVAWALHVMLADNVIDEEEMKLLEALATKHGIRKAERKRLIVAAQAGELELGMPEEANTTHACLEAMAEMALVDGAVTAAERETMHTLGKRLGLGKRKIAKTITEARERLARQGRQRLKALRRKH